MTWEPKSFDSAGVSLRLQHKSWQGAYPIHAKCPTAMTSGKVLSVFLHHWYQVGFWTGLYDFNPNSLLGCLKRVLQLIAVSFKRNSTDVIGVTMWWAYYHLSHWVVFYGWPNPFLSRNVPPALKMTIPMCTDVLEQGNLAARSVYVYPYPCT